MLCGSKRSYTLAGKSSRSRKSKMFLKDFINLTILESNNYWCIHISHTISTPTIEVYLYKNGKKIVPTKFWQTFKLSQSPYYNGEREGRGVGLSETIMLFWCLRQQLENQIQRCGYSGPSWTSTMKLFLQFNGQKLKFSNGF